MVLFRMLTPGEEQKPKYRCRDCDMAAYCSPKCQIEHVKVCGIVYCVVVGWLGVVLIVYLCVCVCVVADTHGGVLSAEEQNTGQNE